MKNGFRRFIGAATLVGSMMTVSPGQAEEAKPAQPAQEKAADGKTVQERNVEIVLHVLVGEGRIAPDEEDFLRTILQGLVYLPSQFVARLQRQYVGENAIALGLELGAQPQRKFVIDRCGLEQRDRLA